MHLSRWIRISTMTAVSSCLLLAGAFGQLQNTDSGRQITINHSFLSCQTIGETVQSSITIFDPELPNQPNNRIVIKQGNSIILDDKVVRTGASSSSQFVDLSIDHDTELSIDYLNSKQQILTSDTVVIKAIQPTAATISHVTCPGKNDGSISLQSSNPMSYVWSTGETSSTISNLSPDQYSVTIENEVTCTEILDFTVHDASTSVIEFKKMTITCNDRQETLLISGIHGATDLNYDWNDDGVGDWDDNSMITLNEDKRYSLEVRNAEGCIVSQNIDSRTLAIIDFGASPVTIYSSNRLNDSWFIFNLHEALSPVRGDLDNDGLEGSIFDVSFHNSFVEAELGINQLNIEYYSEPKDIYARVQSPMSCFDIAKISLQAAIPLDVSLDLNQKEICQQESAIALSGGQPEGGIYSLSDCGSQVMCPQSAISFIESTGEYLFDPSQVDEGDYTISYRYKDADGNENSATDIITVQALNFDFIPETLTICSGSDPVEISILSQGQELSGQGIRSEPLDINGEQYTSYFFDPTNLSSGTYIINSIYVFNSNTTNYTCSQQKSKTLTIVDGPRVSLQPSATELCEGEALTVRCTIVNGGTNPRYRWFGPNGFESNEQDISFDMTSPELGGTYYLEVDNGTTCIVQESVDIQIRKKMEIDVTEVKPVSCFGDHNGIARVVVANPISDYTFEWDSGQSKARATQLGPGTHTVTVTDDLGCTTSGSINFLEPEPLSAEIDITEQIVCNGAANGKASVQPSGGTGAYSIEWSHGDVRAAASGLKVGTYRVTVSDENGCTSQQELVLEEPDILDVQVFSVKHLTCFAEHNAGAEIRISGGNPPYTTEWSNGESGLAATALGAGENLVFVRDAVGCNTARKIQIEEPEATIVSIDRIDPHLCGAAPSGTVSLSVTGPSSYSVEWSNGETAMTAHQLDNGLHYATITDLSGCQVVQEVTVGLTTNMLCQSEELFPATCQNAADGIAMVEVASGTGNYSFSWDNGETSQKATALTPGIHEVTITDENSCQIVCSVTIGVASPIQLACNNVVNLSLAGNCLLNFKPDLVVENYVRDFDFTLRMTDESGDPVDTLLIRDYIGQTLDFVITETCKLSSCWGSINLEDKLGPQLNCSTQTIDCVAHMNSLSKSALPLYDVSDFWYSDSGALEAKLPTDCSVITMSYMDDMLEKDCENPFSHIIQRTWFAKDEYNNESSCIQQINIYRDEHQLVWPYDTSYVYCMSEGMDTETMPELSPDHFGWPKVLGTDSIQSYHNSPCMNLDYVFSDQLIKVCSGSFKILREWVAIQACSGARDSYTQVIYLKSIDFEVVQRDTTIFIESGFDCNTDMYLPIAAPQFCGKVDSYAARVYGELDMEDCQVYTEKQLSTSLALTDDGKLIIPDLELGCNYIEVYLSTDCYETDTLSFYTTVVDYQAPVLICDAQTIVSLGSDGRGHLTIKNIDNGSWDNCGIAHMTLTKQDTICAVDSLDRASDIVSFCCEESGTTVIIFMEATDYHHNKSSCKIEVFVEDGVMPAVECPENVFLACTEDLYDLETTGKPWAEIKCTPIDFYHIDSTELSQCRNEKVERHWYAVFGRDSSFICTQSIQLYNEFKITEENISWPEDVNLDQCSGDLSELLLGEPIVDTLGGCDLIATNFIDREFETSLGSCLSILREWTIIDWCQYNENDEGIWRSSQVIKIHDKVKPTITCEDVEVCAFDRECQGELDMFASASDDCSAKELLTFSYAIDYNKDGQIDNQITDQNHHLILDLPVGNHAMTIYSTDQCGNTNHCTSTIDVVDCKAPTPYCIAETVSTIFNDDDVVEVWATDFNLASRDNCTAEDELGFSFEKDSIVNVLHIRCEDIVANSSERFMLSIWVSDKAGNQDACRVSIRVDQRENNPCDSLELGSAFVISGLVTDVNAQALDDYAVSFENVFEPEQSVVMNGQDGRFDMSTAQKDSYYEIELSKQAEFIDGVTTIDMITLQNHLLGTKVIDNEYKLIAADINRDGQLSGSDLLLMKKLIIGQLTDFPSYEEPWIFKLVENSNISQISDSKFATEDIHEHVHMDVVAIKIGDLDGSAGSFQADAESRELDMLEGIDADMLDVHVFPNPILSQATLSLTLTLDDQPVDVTIMNHEAKIIWNETKSFSRGQHSVDLSSHFQGVQEGLYYIIVHQSGVMKTIKVAKL